MDSRAIFRVALNMYRDLIEDPCAFGLPEILLTGARMELQFCGALLAGCLSIVATGVETTICP